MIPHIEIFQHPEDYNLNPGPGEEGLPPGFYYWFALPGCLPDSDPVGPFETIEEAYSDAEGFVEFT